MTALGGPGIHSNTSWDTLVVWVRILFLLDVLLNFRHTLETNLESWMPQRQLGLEHCCFIEFVRTHVLLWEVVCSESIIDAEVFIMRFHVNPKLEF